MPFQSESFRLPEVDATLGEFDISRRQFDAARAKIEEALKLDPNLAVAQESMGLLLFREDKRSEAQKYFSRAVALDSKSALANYYDGMLLVSGGAEEEDVDEAQAALEKAVALKPELAPAWDALASLYISDPQSRDRARDAAEQAVKAMPGDPRYRFNLAVILVRMGQFDEARAIAQGIGKSGDKEFSAAVEQFLEQIDRQQQAYSGQWNVRNDAPRSDAAQETKDSNAAEMDHPAPVLKSATVEQPNPPANRSSQSRRRNCSTGKFTGGRPIHPRVFHDWKNHSGGLLERSANANHAAWLGDFDAFARRGLGKNRNQGRSGDCGAGKAIRARSSSAKRRASATS